MRGLRSRRTIEGARTRGDKEMGNIAFLVDVDKCTGCKLCVVSCKDEHVGNSYEPWSAPQPMTGHFWVDVVGLERGTLPRVKMSYMPTFCQHCADAPCIKACTDGSIKTRDDGIVWIDPKLCSGCGDCESACPYGVIYLNTEANLAQKCTGCAHRVDEGLLPRCAEACPHDAIVFGEEGQGVFAEAGLEVLHPEFKAQPRVSWKGLPHPWIAGMVIDADKDEVVTGASVCAVDLTDNTTVTVATDAFGDFWIRGLEEGRTYRVEIAMAGYKSATVVVTMDGDEDMGTVALAKA
ncbi:MAG: 4Fe-4S dicluster domain-containing protein [Hyphomicrobiaceae bacterium]